MCVGCAACGLIIAWFVLGGLALANDIEYANGCGWWLWGVFVGQLIYLPFALAFSCIYVSWILSSVFGDEDMSFGHGFLDGCMRAAGFCMLNSVNALGVGFGYKALWDEDCVPHSTQLGVMSQVAFYTFAILLGTCIILGLAEAIRQCIVN